MARSMTGFGRADTEKDGTKFTVEINTVNNRYLEYQIRIPKSLAPLESEIKNLLNDTFRRGKIMVIINWEQALNEGDLALDEAKTDAYMKIYGLLKEKYQIKGDISFRDFVALPDLVKTSKEDESLEEIWGILKPALMEAGRAADEMRRIEGENLVSDMLQRISAIKIATEEVESAAPKNVEIFREKLNSRIKELQGDSPVDEQRIAQEVAILAEKSDITEECIRLKSHMSQFEQSLGQKKPMGKRLNFILQELNREANTIASKSSDYEISHRVIMIKEEIERLREQVQNIE
jgi:uncharacterized protein (TIGR00255 family)